MKTFSFREVMDHFGISEKVVTAWNSTCQLRFLRLCDGFTGDGRPARIVRHGVTSIS